MTQKANKIPILNMLCFSELQQKSRKTPSFWMLHIAKAFKDLNPIFAAFVGGAVHTALHNTRVLFDTLFSRHVCLADTIQCKVPLIISFMILK